MADIFSEVDEDLRHERYQKLWKKYGGLVIAAAMFVVLSVAAVQGWKAWQQNRAEDAAILFSQATDLLAKGQREEADQTFRALLEDDFGGYGMLVRFGQATALVQEGNWARAVELYDEIAAGAGKWTVYGDLARLKAAVLVFETSDYEALKARLAPLSAPDNAWRFVARELAGFAAYRAGRHDEALSLFTGIREATFGVPDGVRARASMMLQVLAPLIKSRERNVADE